MERLTIRETHELIKSAIPEAKTAYDREVEEWLKTELPLFSEEPDLFIKLYENIRRNK